MKIISWNVNGLASISKKISVPEFLAQENPDILCLQEIKCSKKLCSFDNYHSYWAFSSKEGYAGTAIFSKLPAVSELHPKLDSEGRIVGIETADYYIVNIYAPNSQRDLARLPYRLEWDTKLRSWLNTLTSKPVIVCGDFNVSPTELDIAEPKKHLHHPGYTAEERASFQQLLARGMTDAYRHVHPAERAYSFWSYLGKNYERNVGYRCDLFVVSDSLRDKISEVELKKNIRSSDHCPVSCIINS